MLDFAQFVKTPNEDCLYCSIDDEPKVHVVNDDQWIFHDGCKEPPKSEWSPLAFDTRPLPKPHHPRFDHKGECEASRQKRVMLRINDPRTWGKNVAEANLLNGCSGRWDSASDDPNSPNFCAVKKSLDAIAQRMVLVTNGMIQVDSLNAMWLILSRKTAVMLGQTREIGNFIARSPYATAQVNGDLPSRNRPWCLPNRLYYWNIAVEDGKTDDSAVAVYRDDDREGVYGAPSFTTVRLYHYGESILDTEKGWQDNTVEIIQPLTGFMIQGLGY